MPGKTGPRTILAPGNGTPDTPTKSATIRADLPLLRGLSSIRLS